MARLEVPLLGKPLWSTGDILIRAELDILIKAIDGTWGTVSFRVDTGTEMTTMPASLARSLSLPMPKAPIRGGLLLMGNRLEVRAGIIRARVAGSSEFAFPCFFLGDPEAPPHPIARNLLGLTGVADKLRITFDGTIGAGFPHGLMIVEEIAPSGMAPLVLLP